MKYIPTRITSFQVMEPSSETSYSGVFRKLEEMDTYAVWRTIEDKIKDTFEYQDLQSTVDDYIHEHGIESLTMFEDTSRSFIVPLLHSYISSVKSIRYNKNQAFKVGLSLIQHLNSSGVNYCGLIILKNFSAAKSFYLDHDIYFRPISEDDYEHLVEKIPYSSLSNSEQWIYSDSWICEINKFNPRGSFNGSNMISEMSHQQIPLALRMFKGGDIGIRLAELKATSIFEESGTVRGGATEHIALGQQKYFLTNSEIKQFKEFWAKFKTCFKDKEHYLQVPLRRLHRAGTRREKEDSIIDCVIGLESLLGTTDENTEISYRFRIRGAVILAKKKTERPYYLNKLKELYNLRSLIAHGNHTTNKKLNDYLPFAEESLRIIWKWFFIYHSSETSNKQGVEMIDTKLLLK